MAYSIVRPIGCYVYTHRKATTGDVFYVGKGTRERAWDKYGRSELWHRVVRKHGLIVTVEIDGLSDADAFKKEIDLISSLRAEGIRLVNLTDGGEGGSNPSKETREKMGRGTRGKKMSKEQIEKIRASNLGKKRSDETREKIRNRIISEETKQKYRDAIRPAVSESAKAKISESFKKKWQEDEYRNKVINAVTGLRRSADFCNKMSEIAKNRTPMQQDVKEKISGKIRDLWDDPEYRARMKASHAGKGWSEARRAAYNKAKAAA